MGSHQHMSVEEQGTWQLIFCDTFREGGGADVLQS